MDISATAIDQAARRAKRQLVDRFFERPNDFFTEGDVAAFLAHRLHVELDALGLDRALVHLQYPTPFRCSMATREFVRSADDSKHRRGFFDVSVLNPAFLDEFADNYHLSKGQRWDVLQPELERRGPTSEPVALVIFELMFIRDPFWSDQRHEKGAATMWKLATETKLDYSKLMEARKPSPTGFIFAERGEMLVFDNGLAPSAALILRDMVPSDVEIFSTKIGRTGPEVPHWAHLRTWADMDSATRVAAANLKRDAIPMSPGVYAWYRGVERWYVGKAACLRDRIWGNHLGKGASLSGSALRRNVAEHLDYGDPESTKRGITKLTSEQLDAVRAWLLACDVAWLSCATAAEAVDLEARLKTEFRPQLTKI
jgi:hypothetical protein